MTFRGQQWRLVAVGMLFGVLVDLVFVWLLIHFFSDEMSAVEVALGFVMLQAVYLVIGIRNSAAAWLAFWLWGRKNGARHIAELLRSQGFQKRPGNFFGPSDYFQDIAGDESVSVEMRLKAATFSGILAYPAANGRGMEALRWNMIYEEALSQI